MNQLSEDKRIRRLKLFSECKNLTALAKVVGVKKDAISVWSRKVIPLRQERGESNFAYHLRRQDWVKSYLAGLDGATSSCGYYIASIRGICGASCKGTYCEFHLAKTHPYGAGHMAEVMATKLPIREMTP